MSKIYKSLEEQVLHLERDKRMIINDKDNLKEILLNNNYYRFINSIKINFCKSIDDTGKHFYDSLDDKEWIDFFRKEWYLREQILLKVIRIENKINSRVAYYVGVLHNQNCLNRKDIDSIKGNLNNVFLVKNRVFTPLDRNLNEVWKYVSHAEFNIIEKIIKRLYYKMITFSRAYRNLTNPTQEETLKISLLNEACTEMMCGLNIEEITTFRLFRNAVVHQVPLSIFLTNNTLNTIPLQKRYDFIINRLNFKSRVLKEIILNSKKYVSMKRNVEIELDINNL